MSGASTPPSSSSSSKARQPDADALGVVEPVDPEDDLVRVAELLADLLGAHRGPRASWPARRSAATSMEIGNARATTSRPSYSMTGPRVGSSCSRRASCTKLVAASGRWKPTRSAPSRPSTIADRQGSWVNSSNGGNGMCRKKPIVRSGRLCAEQRRDELQLVVVHPDDGALGRDSRRALGEALVDLHVGVPPGAVVLRLLDDVVVQRPQRGVGHALVVAVDLFLGELDRDQRHPAATRTAREPRRPTRTSPPRRRPDRRRTARAR